MSTRRPWEDVERQQGMTRRDLHRMDFIRGATIIAVIIVLIALFTGVFTGAL